MTGYHQELRTFCQSSKRGSVPVAVVVTRFLRLRFLRLRFLTTFIENGYQRNLKTGAVFLNLSAAYDTVWHTGLLVKLSRSQPIWVVDAVETLLRGRQFRVHMGSHESSWRHQINGLPQGSVLAPTLFNLYTNDLPKTESRKFIYADDICCATQASSFEVLETTLSADMVVLEQYCRNWRLIPSVSKTVSSVFHLHNASAQSAEH